MSLAGFGGQTPGKKSKLLLDGEYGRFVTCWYFDRGKKRNQYRMRFEVFVVLSVMGGFVW